MLIVIYDGFASEPIEKEEYHDDCKQFYKLAKQEACTSFVNDWFLNFVHKLENAFRCEFHTWSVLT